MSVRAKSIAIALLTMAFLWANLEAYPHPDGMSNVLLAYRFITAGTANVGPMTEKPKWQDKPKD